MTHSETVFFNLLRYSIHPDAMPQFDNVEWEQIVEISKKQNLFPLIFDAASSLPGFEQIEKKYFQEVAERMSVQMQNTSDFFKLYTAFLEDGISPIVLKGIVCRELYGEKGDLRVSGDEDILIKKSDYDTAYQTLERCGYTTKDVPDKEMELIQEVTFYNPDTKLTIELHLNLFGGGESIRMTMNEWFQDVYDSKEMIIVNGISIRTLEPTSQMLFLILHTFKHFISGGCGVRLMLDTLLFAEKHQRDINWDYVMSCLNAIHACGFYNDLVLIGNEYLGFHLPATSETCPDELLADMLRMGTFGNTNEIDITAAKFTQDIIRSNELESIGTKKRFRSYIRRVFPSWDSWVIWKPYLKDKPWMVVPEWFWRIGRYLRHETSMGDMKEINASYEIAERRLELLKKYNIS